MKRNAPDRQGGPAGNPGAERFETHSTRGTIALGRTLARRLDVGDCVALIGGLGAGKTALVRGMAVGMGLAEERLVSSPTYVLVHEYPCRLPVYHLDLYRMVDPDAELFDLGLDEMLAAGVVLIEWADRVENALPRDHTEIRIEIPSPTHRQFTLRAGRQGEF